MTDAILTVIKPAGITTYDVVRKAKAAFKCKAGHGGTLDPTAEGLVIILLGRYTKYAQKVLFMKKVYSATIVLGKATTTYDSEGEAIFTGETEHITKENVIEKLSGFRGTIEQQVPPFSAAKHQGKPLYEYARRGIMIEKTKKVTIDSLDLLNFDRPEISVRVACSSGTYVRSIAHELGQKLGCGAYLSTLTREEIGPFSIKRALAIDAFTSLEKVVTNNRENMAVLIGSARERTP